MNKSTELQVELVQNRIDICSLTETWIRDDDTAAETQMCPLGYKAISVPRSNRQGGGIAIVYRDFITIHRSNTYDYTTMECSDFAVSLPGLSLNMAVIYRPPDKPVCAFVNDFLEYMERNINSTGKLLLTGDFNIHINDPESPDTNTFLDVLDSFGLRNHTSFPTHHFNNTLDIVITPCNETFIENSTPGRLFSDHNIVYFNIITFKQPNTIKDITFRKLKNINMTNFNKDVELHLSIRYSDKLSLTEKIQLYRNTLRVALDKHAPLKRRKVPDRIRLAWFSDEIAMVVQKRRKAERKWYALRSDATRFLEFYRARRMVRNMLVEAERRYYQNQLQDNSNNSKKIFGICNSILGRK